MPVISAGIDGHDSGSAGSFVTSVSNASGLTTTNPNDVIIALIMIESAASTPGVSGIADTAGLSGWERRNAVTGSVGAFLVTVEEWWAQASSVLTGDIITASLSGGTPLESSICVFGVNMVANPASPFDANGSLPASGQSPVSSGAPSVGGISTTATNTLMFAMTANYNGGGSGNPVAPFLTIDIAQVAGAQDNQSTVFGSSQSSIAVSFGDADDNNGWVMLVDAIQVLPPQFIVGVSGLASVEG